MHTVTRWIAFLLTPLYGVGVLCPMRERLEDLPAEPLPAIFSTHIHGFTNATTFSAPAKSAFIKELS